MGSLYYKKIIILGAKGFLGHNLESYLRRHGAAVLGLDLPELDVTDRASLERAASLIQHFRQEAPAACINAAGLMDATTSLRDPERFYAVNGKAVGRIHDLCRRLHIGAFIQLSSETVFGAGDEAFDEDGNRVPRHPYGFSKLLAEVLLEEAFSGDLALPVLRLPVVVGIGQAVGNPVSIFCHQATTTGVIEVFNGGGHRRKFISVNDVSRQVAALLGGSGLNPALQFYNVGGFVASMREVAEAVNSQVPEACIADRESDRQAFSLFSTSRRIQRDFGFVPQDGLPEMIAAFLRPAHAAAAAGHHVARARG